MRWLSLRLVVLVCAAASFARAEDWPQWLGPKRDGILRETGLMERFPEGGPPVLWRTPINPGYAGPAVVGGRVYLLDRTLKPDAARSSDPYKRVTVAGTERALCLSAADGKIIWSHSYDCPYSISYGAGPRAVPAVDGDRVYTLGAEGNLLCLETATGNVVWEQRLSSEKKPTPTWGFAGHPLVDGEKLICTTADPAAVIAAFDKMTGKLIWSALSSSAGPGYSPPVIYDVAGKRQLITWNPESVNSLDPETGKVYWTVKHGPIKYGGCIIMPKLYHDERVGDLLYVSTQYEGSLMLKLTTNDRGEPAAAVLWKRVGKSDRKTDALQILMSTPIIRDSHLYGVDILGQLRCLDVSTGDRVWETTAATTYDAGPQSWATAFIIQLGDTGNRYLLPNEHGDLILAEMSPEGFKLISQAHLLEPTNNDPGRDVVWSSAAFADHCIYWRNDKEIICASLAAK